MTHPDYFSVSEVMSLYGWSRAYVYKQALRHRWLKVTLAGRAHYLIRDVERARRASGEIRAGSNPLIR